MIVEDDVDARLVGIMQPSVRHRKASPRLKKECGELAGKTSRWRYRLSFKLVGSDELCNLRANTVKSP
jgi:hypothetical protein